MSLSVQSSWPIQYGLAQCAFFSMLLWAERAKHCRILYIFSLVFFFSSSPFSLHQPPPHISNVSPATIASPPTPPSLIALEQATHNAASPRFCHSGPSVFRLAQTSRFRVRPARLHSIPRIFTQGRQALSRGHCWLCIVIVGYQLRHYLTRHSSLSAGIEVWSRGTTGPPEWRRHTGKGGYCHIGPQGAERVD